MPDATDINAITVSAVSKDFLLPHEKRTSAKSFFVGMFRRNKGTEHQHALKGIDFSIKKGEFFGIVGRNGSGKSTLLKILAGIYQPTRGAIQVEGKLVPFIELGVGFNPELTGRENVYLNGALLGFSNKQIEKQYDDIVAFAELERFMDQKLKNYSSGMQVRLAFSLATRARADILLVDEVLAVGDAAFQRKCFEYFRTLKREGRTVVFVSHDMNAVREYCDRAILIEKSELVAEGKPDRIASLYSKMFIEKQGQNSQGEDENAERWGDGKITYDTITIERVQDSSGDRIRIEASAIAHEAVDGPNFGFLLRNASGVAILGTNSHNKKHFIDRLEDKERIVLTWEFDNILNDDTYYVEPAIVYSGTETADWWERAASLEVRKEMPSPYPVNPEIDLVLKAEKAK